MRSNKENLLKELPLMVRNEIEKMGDNYIDSFLDEYLRRRKSEVVAYILWLFLGWHYIYLRKWLTQILFWGTLGGLFVWWFIDFFRIPNLVKDYNRDVAIQVLKDIKDISIG